MLRIDYSIIRRRNGQITGAVPNEVGENQVGEINCNPLWRRS